MQRRDLLIVLVALWCTASCGGPKNPSPAPGNDSVESIRGTERLGWDQQAVSRAELATFHYAIYIDGTRSELAGAACGGSAGAAGYPCNAPLPPFTPGSHTLELATFVTDGGTISESARSAPLRVMVTASTASTQAPASASPPAPASDDALPAAATLIDGLDDPTDLAFAPDGRLLIAERTGTVRALRAGVLEARPALTLNDTLIAGEGGGLLSISLHPEYERTRLMYALQTVAGRAGEPVFRVVRFREAGGTFGERAILIDGVPASAAQTVGRLRFGPDRALYVALDDGGDHSSATSAAAYNGKVLRLNADGSTPSDQPAGSPVYASGYALPCSLDWRTDTGALWVADCRRDLAARLVAVTPRVSKPRGFPREDAQVLPARARLRSAAFYRGDLIPGWRDDLLLAADEGLLRVRFDPSDPSRIARVDVADVELGPVRAIVNGPDGAVYACTRTSLVRLTARR